MIYVNYNCREHSHYLISASEINLKYYGIFVLKIDLARSKLKFQKKK